MPDSPTPETEAYQLKGENLICFSTADWDTLLPTNKHQLMRRLARRNKVLFIETLGTRAPKLGSGTDLRRIGKRLQRSFEGSVRRSKQLWTLSPLVRPNWSSAFARGTNRAAFQFQMRQSLKQFPNPIVWVYSPYAVHLLDLIPDPKVVVYHLVDDLSAVPGADQESLREAENRLLARADCVFCTEQSLYDRARLISPSARLMPNVADFKHFSQVRITPESESWKQYQQLNGPRIVFSGNLAPHKVDLKLILKLAKEHPDWNMVLIGPEWEGGDGEKMFGALKRRKNVLLTGHVPYKELPAFLHQADVLLIPYVKNSATRAVFPLKFFEYLGTGKPVVASPLVSLLPYRDAVMLAEKSGDWSKAIQSSLEEPDRMAEQRQVLARRNTWKHRMQEMEQELALVLKQK